MTASQGQFSNQLVSTIPGFFVPAGQRHIELAAEQKRLGANTEEAAKTDFAVYRNPLLRPISLFRFARRLPTLARLTFSVRDGREFLITLAPLVVLARFFGTPVSICLLASHTEQFVMQIGRVGRAFLRLADRIETTSSRSAHILERWDIESGVIHEPLDLSRIPARTIDRVQPRILVFTSDLWRQDFVTVLGAFEAIKSKYPRAELVVAGPDMRAEGVVGSGLLQGGLTRARLESFDDYLALCRNCDIYLATNPIDITPLPALAAMASGLPAVIPPLGDIRPHTSAALLRSENSTRVARGRIVEAVIDLIEKPGLAQSLSEYSLQAVRQYAQFPKEPSSGGSWRMTG